MRAACGAPSEGMDLFPPGAFDYVFVCHRGGLLSAAAAEPPAIASDDITLWGRTWLLVVTEWAGVRVGGCCAGLGAQPKKTPSWNGLKHRR